MCDSGKNTCNSDGGIKQKKSKFGLKSEWSKIWKNKYYKLMINPTKFTRKAISVF